MSKSKLFSIVTIACFVSILCIPLGIVLMLYYTKWKKKTKIILTISLTAFYAGLIAFFFLIKPAYNTSGLSLPFGSNSGYTAFEAAGSGSGSGSGSGIGSGSGSGAGFGAGFFTGRLVTLRSNINGLSIKSPV